MKLFILGILLALAASAQTTINGSRNILGAWDASGATSTKPVKSGTATPGTCAVPEMFFETDATAGTNIWLCTATNTWTQVLAGLADPGGNGMLARTSAGVTTARTITGTANEVAVTNGDGVSGNPTLALPSTVVLSSKTVRVPNSTTLPGTCVVGEIYMDTDATSGSRWYLCEATNSWVVQGGSATALTAAATSGGDNTVMRSVGDSRAMEGTGCTISDTHQLTCTGGTASLGTTAGITQLYEAAANGSNYLSIEAPDAITDTQRLKVPATANTVDQTLRFPAPSGGISQASWSNPLWRNTGTSLPGTCTVGESFQKTDATATAQWYLCTATNTWTAQGAAGGGVQRVAYASVPGTCDSSNQNNLYLTTDGFLKMHSNGSACQWYWRDVAITLPGVVSGWTAVNSPAEAVDVAGAVYLRDAAHANASVKSLIKAISGSDWTITIGMSWEGAGINFNTCGLILAAGSASTNRALILGLTSVDSSTGFIRSAYDYATNYTTGPTSDRLAVSSIAHYVGDETQFIRVTKSGGNWTYSFSKNGVKFSDYKTEAAVFTATHAGFACDARGDGTGEDFAAATFFHYVNQ